jgi:anhydro-N-acetylmuramic acid kinase
MNPNIQKLYDLALKKERIIIGLMSGTSVDGLDIALCKISGKGMHTKVTLLEFETSSYTEAFRNNVASIFSKRTVDLEAVCLINEWIGEIHGKLITASLKKWNITPAEVDLIASHGQTIYHAPYSLHQNNAFGNGTLQIGDGDHIAVTTGIITISDFRQKHIAAGGEGAPLAVYGDYLIFGKKGENRLLLNIGGIANFTYLPASMDSTQVFSTDVGPGNTIMDAYVKKHFGKDYDENAAFAKQGICQSDLLNALLNHSFFESGFPKTTGPELFNLNYLEQAQLKSNSQHLSKEDVLNTLNAFSATVIVMAIKKAFTQTKDFTILSSGGGMHNNLLMERIQTELPNCIFLTTSEIGILPDAKEAVLFAILANETIMGNDVNLNAQNTAIPNITMGKISFPN